MDWYFILLIIVGTLGLGIGILILLYFRYITPIQTGKISEKVSVIRTGIVNAFVYSKGANRILIDTGTNSKKLLKGLEELKIDVDSISDVFFTHGDPDHIGGNSLFENVPFHIGAGSKVKEEYTRYKFLADGDVIEIGDIKVQAISTPGHRLGHTIYQIDDEFLFTGDALRLKDGKVTPFLKIISSDYDKQVKSIHMIADLGYVKYMFTAHNGYTEKFGLSIQEWRVPKRKE